MGCRKRHEGACLRKFVELLSDVIRYLGHVVSVSWNVALDVSNTDFAIWVIHLESVILEVTETNLVFVMQQHHAQRIGRILHSEMIQLSY